MTFQATTLFPMLDRARVTEARPLIVDSFAGGGGASTGIEAALGRGPDIAINHSAAALALHAANHPDTLHLSENVYRVDPLGYMAGRHIGLMWFSPDCKHFSKAKGGAPVKRNIRDLAWIIPGWIERIQKSGGKVDVVLLENVEEFKTWGPVVETDRGTMPDPARAGETFKAWCKALKRLGGKVQMRELRACDYGAPTIRKRLFVVVRFDGDPIIWPEPTHGAPDSPEVKAGKRSPWRTAAECIDWSLPCPSIFDSAPKIMAKHGLRAQRPLAPNTLARIARGMARYVLGAGRPFVVNTANGKTTGRGPNAWGDGEPLRTITSSGGFAAVVPSIVGCGGRAGQSRPRGADEAFATVTAKADACIVAASITRFNGGATGADLRDPMPTVTANSWIKKPGGAMPLGLLSPYLATFYGHADGRGKRAADPTEPLRTVTCDNRHAIVAPHLLALKGSARRSCDAASPHPTVLAGGGHSAIVAPILTYAQQGGANRSATLPHHTICASTKDQNALIAAHLMTMRNAQKPFNGADEPTHTVTAGGAGLSAVAAFLAQQNGGPRMGGHAGHDPREPISTIAASGSHQTPVAAFFSKYYGTGDGARSDEPLHTVTVKDRMGHIQADLAVPPFGPEHHARAREVAEFLRGQGAWDGGEFVTLAIDGAEFVVVDIGMRMLTPRELFNAQGFPPDYVIEGVWQGVDSDTPVWRPLPGHVQVSCCGNSVCPPLAEALVRANCAHLAEMAAA